MFRSTTPWVELTDTSRIGSDFENKKPRKQQRHERRISENNDEYGQDDHDKEANKDMDDPTYDDNANVDKPAMNVVVNTNSAGSQVTVTIENISKDKKMKQEKRNKKLPVTNENYEEHKQIEQLQDLEKHNLLKEVRDLLISQKVETNERENMFQLPQKKSREAELSAVIRELNPIIKRYKHDIKNGDANAETGFFGLLKTKSRVYPIVMGELGKMMAKNTTIIQEHMKSPNRTKNLLLNDFERKTSSKLHLPAKKPTGRNKMIRLFHRSKSLITSKETDKLEPKSVPIKFNALPVLQNIQTNSKVSKQLETKL